MSVFDIERLTNWITTVKNENVRNECRNTYSTIYKNFINYNSELDKVTLPIHHTNMKEFYIDADIIHNLLSCGMSLTPMVLRYSFNYEQPFQNSQCEKRYFKINDGILKTYIGVRIEFAHFITSNKPIDCCTFKNLYNTSELESKTLLSYYNHITPYFIDLEDDENINKINRRLNNLELSNLELQNENKLLKEKIRTNEIELHYLKSTNKEKKIKYNYEEIKNRNKKLNQEFKRVYKLISNNVGFNLMS